MAQSWTGLTGLSTAQLKSKAATLSHPIVGSLSIKETFNVKQTWVNLATGDGQYTVDGYATGDVLLDGNYVRFSGGVCMTVGDATVTHASDTLVSFSGVVSFGLGEVSWIDVSV